MTRQLAASWRLGAPDPTSGTAAVARVPSAPRRGLRSRRPLFWISLALHALAIAVLLLSANPKPAEDELGQPSISVVLAPGDTSTSPAPTPQAAIGTPDAEMVQRAAPPDALPPVPPGAAEQPQTEPVERPIPSLAFAPQAAPPPPPTTTPTPTPTPAPPSAPASAAPVTPVPEPDLPVPPIPPSVFPPQVANPPAPPLREATAQPPPVRLRPRPQPPAHQAPSPRRTAPSGFPMPMFSSLGGALPDSRQAARAPSREMAGPVKPSSTASYMPQLDVSGDNLGSDYTDALHRFWEKHAYYPRGAAENNEDGNVVVKVVIGRNGKVKSLNLVSRSGSVFLDAAGQATWRDHQLPPLPADWHQDEATVFIDMHYILLN